MVSGVRLNEGVFGSLGGRGKQPTDNPKGCKEMHAWTFKVPNVMAFVPRQRVRTWTLELDLIRIQYSLFGGK